MTTVLIRVTVVSLEWVLGLQLLMDIRDRTLAALETYATAQHALLERTQHDVQRLRLLRSKAEEQPDTVLSRLTEELSDPAFRLSEMAVSLQEAREPPAMQWEIFQHHDSEPFKGFSKCNIPTVHFQTPIEREPSELQAYVHESALNLFAVLPPISPSPPASPEPEPIAPPRKKRRMTMNSLNGMEEIECLDGGWNGTPGELRRTSRTHKPKAMKTRESIVNHVNGFGRSPARGRGGINGHGINGDTRGRAQGRGRGRSCRGRSGSRGTSVTPSTSQLREDTESVFSSEIASTRGDTMPPPDPPVKIKFKIPEHLRHMFSPASPSPDKTQVPRSKAQNETFNQPWSLEEQHMLERLLIEFPKGAKNRFSLISQAMEGQRTPRQVASRVQKWHNKLKRNGIDPG